MAESMVKLSHVNMFYSSGPPMQNMIALDHFPPLGEGAGIKALDAIMSNRRFRKVFDEISKMDKAAASEVVNRELLAAIAEYLPLYDGHMRRFAPHFKPYTTNSQHVVVGPSFEVGNVPEGQVTIVGTKLKVLALVWICGMLELNGTKDQVEHVARLSVRQRTDLYEDPILSPIHKYELLEMASLYNRPIISSGVFGMQTNRNLEAHILKAAGAEWQERKLAVFTAALTEYDFYARRGRKPDYSRGSLTVKFVSPLNDDSFDLVLRELHVF